MDFENFFSIVAWLLLLLVLGHNSTSKEGSDNHHLTTHLIYLAAGAVNYQYNHKLDVAVVSLALLDYPASVSITLIRVP